jgi:hypothetical protein
MRIVTYGPEHFPALARVAATARTGRSLGHQPFVDYYYTTRDWCRLYLALGADGEIVAAIGVEHIPFEHLGQPLSIGFASNFVTFQPGAGGYLFLHWVRSTDVTCIYGGSPDTHRIIQSQKWTYYPGVKTYRVNARYKAAGRDAPWRRAAKSILRALAPSIDLHARVAAVRAQYARENLAIREESTITEDMVPSARCFSFRLAADAEYLRWRYATDLSFVRYRVFRLLCGTATSGYVVINAQHDRLMVAQADADDPISLAVGILLALGEVARDRRRPPEVVLASPNHVMQEVFRAVGFEADPNERPFALGAKRHPLRDATDTSTWLVNLDWTDNGLRSPFLDELPAPAADAARAAHAS